MRNIVLGITVVLLFIVLITCSLSGDMDKIWQEVRESASYTVTFNASGGTPAPNKQTVRYGEKASEPAAMEKSDCFFSGWYKEAGCINVWDFSNDLIKKETTLYAKWEDVPENSHIVRFIITGAISRPLDQVVVDGSKIIQPDNPERNTAGYIFGNWYMEGSVIPWNFADDPVTEETTLYGDWKSINANQYAVRFKAAGGSPVPPDQALQAGQKIIEPDTLMARAGYTFGGWYKDENCTEPWLFNRDTVSGTSALYAKWNEGSNRFTVNFITKGGVPIPAQQIVSRFDPVDEPTEYPVRTGYIFTGDWYASEDFISPWVFGSDPVTGNLMLYAGWTPITYTITYYGNNNTGGSTAASAHTYDEPKNLTVNGFTRTDYTFAGWNTQANGSGTSYSNGQSVTNLRNTAGNVDLYAQWAPFQYAVSFSTEGGSSAPATQIVNPNALVHKPADPTREYEGVLPDSFDAGLYRHEYVFQGWFLGASQWDFNNPVTGDMTLRADWGEPALIDPSGSGDIVTRTVEYINTYPAIYTLLLDTNADIDTPQTISGTDLSLTLLGKDTKRIISFTSSSKDSLFTLGSGTTLILDNNITLCRNSTSAGSTITINGGTLRLRTGAEINGD